VASRDPARTAAAEIGRVIELTGLRRCGAVISQLPGCHAPAGHERSGGGIRSGIARIAIPVIVRVSIAVGIVIGIAIIPGAKAIA
jgi:hypothetical protein